jgi:hypothetical protein
MSSELTVRISWPCGRLGNHMFEYATIRAVSLKYGHKIYWDDPMLRKTFSGIQNQTDKIGENEIQVTEPGFEYFEINPYNRSIKIDGFRQSWKYFDEYKEQIFQDFKFHQFIEDDVQKFLEPLRKLEKQIIAVQIRRGDYVTNQDHISPTINEILNGINYIDKKYDSLFLFISDDIKWCKENFGNLPNVYFSENHSEGFDLCLMSHCNHGLISASTYGWWGMYLNTKKDKEVIVLTEKWFSDHVAKNIIDLLPVGFKMGISNNKPN